MSYEAFTNFAGYMGTILTFGLTLSPLKSIIEGLKTMTIKNISPVYLQLGIVNALLWSIYGLKLSLPPAYAANLFTLFFFTFYLNAYYYIVNERTNMIIYSSITVALFILVYTILSVSLIGFLSSVLATIFYLSILIKLKESMEKRSNEYLNMMIITASWLASIFWTIFGLMLFDIYIYGPNSLGIIIFGLNYVVYYWNLGKIKEDNFLIELLKKILRVEDEKNHISNNLYQIFRDDSLNKK